MLTEKILSTLTKNKFEFTYLEHEQTSTCEASANARGEELAIGGKTLLFKDKNDYRLFVISAALQVDSTRVRHILRSNKLRFASQEELMQLAGVPKGALPPLGRDFLPYDLYVDYSILYNDRIAFNPGNLHSSIIMKTNDWLQLVDPKFCSFSK